MQQNDISMHVPRQALHVPKWTVVIGANTGGPEALSEILPKLPSYLSLAVVIMQQMRPGFTRVLADQLSHVCLLPVCEPEDGQALQSSRIYIPPSGSRLTFENVGDIAVPAYSMILEDVTGSAELKQSRTDAAMISAAQVFGSNAIGVLLTGLGNDGREGMRAITAAGGITIAQDQASSIIHDLPASAIQEGLASAILPLWSISDHIIEAVGGPANAVAA